MRSRLPSKAKRSNPTAIDLFAGAGGTGWGLAAAGFKILAAVDTDKNAAATYQRNLGVVVTQKDLSSLSPARLRRALRLKKGELDILAGCPPCQGFTRLRNSDGANDP